MALVNKLTRGLNLTGFSGGINMAPGEATDVLDMLPRSDGAIFSHWGSRRIHSSALSSRIVAHKGFSYKGKNTGATRTGNLGIADDGANFTRRKAFYSGAIVLTETECRYWDPSTEALAGPVSLPAGVSVDIQPKPSLVIAQNNVYIAGWADSNLRFDPVDRALYEWGWASTPTIVGGSVTVTAGGNLVANATYKYRFTWIDLYTGEESGPSAELSRTTTASNLTVTFAAGAFPRYSGLRHYINPVGGPPDTSTNQDVGIVVYRTEADQEEFHFLDTVNPRLDTATLTDNGLATDASLGLDVLTYSDWPRLNALAYFRGMFWGLSWDTNTSRVFYNDFRAEKSFLERRRALDVEELALGDGEAVTALAHDEKSLIALTNRSAYKMSVRPDTGTGIIIVDSFPLDWIVGAVGPLAWSYVDGYLYFLSDRGPYRSLGGARPEAIGTKILSLFIDPTSGVCKLNPAAVGETVVAYDPDADLIRMSFAIGDSQTPNAHLGYWPHPEFNDGDSSAGWFRYSPRVQNFDFTNAYGPLDESGNPVTPFTRRERVVYSDHNGYVYEFDPELGTYGLPHGQMETAIIDGATLNPVALGDGLYTVGGGLAGLRFEVQFADGTYDIREIVSNTGSAVTLDRPLSQSGNNRRAYLGGIPSSWRSWVDHGGDPTKDKKLVHFYVGLNRQRTDDDMTVVLEVAAGKSRVPSGPFTTKTVTLDLNTDKKIINRIGKYFIYNISNSNPNEPFVVTFIDPDLRVVARRR